MPAWFPLEDPWITTMSLHTICLLTQKRVWCGDWVDIVVLLASQTTVTESRLGLRDLGAIRHLQYTFTQGLGAKL